MARTPTFDERTAIQFAEKRDVEYRYECFNMLLREWGFSEKEKIHRDRNRSGMMSVKLPQDSNMEMMGLLGRLADEVRIAQWRDKYQGPEEVVIFYTQYRFWFRGLKPRYNKVKES